MSFSHSVMSDSLWPHGPQHARLLCPSLSSGACSNSCPLSWWRCLTILSSVTPFSFCLRSFPASGSFPMSRLFGSGDQRNGVSASVLSMNIQGWFPLGSTGLISLLSKGLKSLLQHHSSKALVFKYILICLFYYFVLIVADIWLYPNGLSLTLSNSTIKEN